MCRLTVYGYAVAKVGICEDFACICNGQGGATATRLSRVERLEGGYGCAVLVSV